MASRQLKSAKLLPRNEGRLKGSMPLPVADGHSFGIIAKMTGKADISARIAAICYTLVIIAMVWFTFAFFGFETGGDVGGAVVFALIALSPIPVCILCFRRN